MKEIRSFDNIPFNIILMGNSESNLPSAELAIQRKRECTNISRKIKMLKSPVSESKDVTEPSSTDHNNSFNLGEKNSQRNLERDRDFNFRDESSFYDRISLNSGSVSFKMSNSIHTRTSDLMSEDIDYLADSNAFNSFINSNVWEDSLPSRETISEPIKEIKVSEKNDSELLRQNYMIKLTKMQIGKKLSLFQSVLIASWDDTLFCTSYLQNIMAKSRNKELDEDVKSKIEKLEKTLVKLLSTALHQEADVYIISDAKKGWIEESIKTYLPRVRKIIDNYSFSRLTIVYTQEFNKTEQGEITDCKLKAVEWIFMKYKDHFSSAVFNIVCLTDSMHLIEYINHVVQDQIKKGRKESEKSVFIKTLKLKDTPEIEDIIKQEQLIIDQFKVIYGSIRSINIKVKVSVKK